MAKFVNSDRNQRLLLPPDLRDWVPEDDLAHFVIEAVERVDLSAFSINDRGTGSAQYHPRMMLALLIYCYANGIFSSRRIERATYRDIGVRYIAGNVHPDHDTICKFRRENVSAIAQAFLEVLLLARELKLLKVGRVSVDGSKIDANANKHKSIRYDRAKQLREQLQEEINGLLQQAEAADKEGAEDPNQLPEQLRRREDLKSKLDEACRRLEERARKQAEREQAEWESRMAERDKRPGCRKGKKPKPPRQEPEETEQINLTDPDSRLMRKNRRSSYRQAYNVQAVVDAEGSQLVLGTRVSQCASDRNELVADVRTIDPSLGQPTQVLADNGFANGDQVETLQEEGIDILISTGRRNSRKYDFRPERPVQERKPHRQKWLIEMEQKLDSEAGRQAYRLRQQTVEPVFGIIKSVMGFRQFLRRGLANVSAEWELVALAYNCKRLHRLQLAAA